MVKTKSFSILSLIILSTISFINSEDNSYKPEGPFAELRGTHLTTSFPEYLNNSDNTLFVFYYKPTSGLSLQIASVLPKIEKRLEYLLEFVYVNCNLAVHKDTDACKYKKPDNNDINMDDNTMEELEKNFFRLAVFTPPLYKYNPYTKKKNSYSVKVYDKVNFEETPITNFITSGIISRSVKLQKETYKNFIEDLKMNKFILVTSKEKTPLLFRGMSNYFYGKIAFGEVHESEKDIIKKLGVTKIPCLVLYQSYDENFAHLDEPNIIIYEGQNKASEIVKFLENYAFKDTSNAIPNNGIVFTPVKIEKLNYFFEKAKKTNIMLYFTNQEDIYKDKDKDRNIIDYEKIPESIQRMNRETQGFFKYGLIDCFKKEEECKKQFNLEEVPGMIFYPKYKKPDPSNPKAKIFYETVEERIKKSPEIFPVEYREMTRKLNNFYDPTFKEANQNTLGVIMGEIIRGHKLPLVYLFDSILDPAIILLNEDEKIKKVFTWVLYSNPDAKMMSDFQAQKLPAIGIAFTEGTPEDPTKGGVKILPYKEEITFHRIKTFLESIVKFQGKDDEDSNRQSEAEIAKDGKVKVNFASNNKDLEKFCTEKKLCMIAFFDMRNKNFTEHETTDVEIKDPKEADVNYDPKFEMYKNLSKIASNRPTSFVYVNSTCQSEFSSKFGIDQANLPNAVIYSFRKGVFANFIGIFNEENLNEFITKVISGRVSFNRIQKENALLNEKLNCSSIVETIAEDDDAEFMKELLEEERKKRAALEKEIQDMSGEKKKKKKKKKKHDM
ncbi:MAG: hypothetical protein MJ252_17910 [archaeon]|nr:hypothetical protein [archaeon]